VEIVHISAHGRCCSYEGFFLIRTLCNTRMFQCFSWMCCLHQAAGCSRTFQWTFTTSSKNL